MAVTQNIVKLSRQQAVVKFVSQGGGQSNINLADFKKSDETYDPANVTPRVTITGIFNDLDGQATITRNSNVILMLCAGQSDKWDFSQAFGFVLDDQSNANVNVNFTANGTIIVMFSKAYGYVTPNQNLLRDMDK